MPATETVAPLARNRKPETASSLMVPVLILCALALLLGWIPRLRWGYWTDEAGTFWMASQGWKAAIDRTGQWAGQSILYSILESFFITGSAATPPWTEALSRIPSIAAMLAAAWQMKKLAERLLDSSAGWVALVPFLCSPDIAHFGTNARPYALALAASLASFRYLVDWQAEGNKSAGIKYLAASILTLHMHYLFGFVFVIQAAYLLFCWWRGIRVRWSAPLIAAVLLPASLLPLLGALKTTAQNTTDFAHATPPEWLQLVQWWFPPASLLTLALGGVVLLISAKGVRWKAPPVRPEAILLIAAWLLPAPLIFFAVAKLTPHSIFAARYMLFTLPAFLLAAVWLICGLERKQWRMVILLATFAGTTLHPGSLLYVFHDSASSWREPIAVIAQRSGANAPPVFIMSGMANSGGLNWQQHDPRTSHLFSALTAYPLQNPMVPLSYQFGDDAKDFLRSKFKDAAARPSKLFLLTAGDTDLGPWMTELLKGYGFAAERIEVNDYVVVEFNGPAARRP